MTDRSIDRRDLQVAAIQFEVGESKASNIENAARLVAEASSRGARLVLLPEKWTGFGRPEVLRATAEPIGTGQAMDAMSRWAKEHSIYVVGGSITELHDDGSLTNTCAVHSPSGELVAEYRKIHLFDVDLGTESYRESDLERAGEHIVTVDVDGWVVGLSICFDLRFPELYRILALKGANLLVVPAAFTMMTGRDHWEPLLRARAIENQTYVLAANEYGTHHEGKRTYGRSMVIDPWGTVVAQAHDGEAIVLATIEASRVDDVRSSIPSLQNRRPQAYRWPDGSGR